MLLGSMISSGCWATRVEVSMLGLLLDMFLTELQVLTGCFCTCTGLILDIIMHNVT